MKFWIKLVLCLMPFLIPSGYAQGEDLRAYYEQKKAEVMPTFTTPELGSEVTLKMASGQTRTGVLMRLNAEEISIITDAGDTVSYKRGMLHESTRAQFFAEDFAHVKAMELTRQYSKEIQLGALAEEEANTHEGRLDVTAKTEKKADTEKEEKEGENRESEKTVTRTTTRTEIQSQILTVSISNLTSHPDTYSLHWYFISEDAAGDKISVHESGTKKVTVDARKRITETVKSKDYKWVKASTVHTGATGYSSEPRIKESGEEPAGYLIILKYNDEILDAKASSKTFLGEEWMQKVRHL